MSSSLADELCDCRKLPLLNKDEVEELLLQLVKWQVEDKALVKKFKFEDFTESLKMTNKVGDIAEEMWHHPDLKLGWGYLEITITTHSAGGLSRADFILAAKIDRII